MPTYLGDRSEPTVIIKERIQRDGYVLVLTHEVPKSQEYRDCRLIRESNFDIGWYGTLTSHLVWNFDYNELHNELVNELSLLTGMSERLI